MTAKLHWPSPDRSRRMLIQIWDHKMKTQMSRKYSERNTTFMQENLIPKNSTGLKQFLADEVVVSVDSLVAYLREMRNLGIGLLISFCTVCIRISMEGCTDRMPSQRKRRSPLTLVPGSFENMGNNLAQIVHLWTSSNALRAYLINRRLLS